MRQKRRIRLFRRLAVGLAVVAVAVPAAGAAPDPRGADGADGATGAAFVQGVTDFPGTSALQPRVDRGPAAGYRRALPADYGVAPVVRVVEGPRGFDWSDALAGAGAALGLALVAAGAARATRRQTRPAAA